MSSEQETALVVQLVHLLTSGWTLLACALLLAALVALEAWDTFGRPPWGRRGSRALLVGQLVLYPLALVVLCAALFFRAW